MTDPVLIETWTDDDGQRWGRWSNGQVVEVDVLNPVNTDPVWRGRGKHRPPIRASKSSTERVQKCRDRKRRGVRSVTMRVEVTDDFVNEKVREGQISADALNNPDELDRAMTQLAEALMGL